MKYTEAILSNSTRKVLWFEIIKILIAVKKNKFTVSFIIIFGTLAFPIAPGAEVEVAQSSLTENISD